MQARHIDHVNLRIPADGVDDAQEFYGEKLGFGIEDAPYVAGDKPFFDVRLSPTAVIHCWPSEEFEPPTATNYDHVAVVVEGSADRRGSRPNWTRRASRSRSRSTRRSARPASRPRCTFGTRSGTGWS